MPAGLVAPRRSQHRHALDHDGMEGVRNMKIVERPERRSQRSANEKRATPMEAIGTAHVASLDLQERRCARMLTREPPPVILDPGRRQPRRTE